VRYVALISDIHGNLTALDAVLADIDAAGIGERYCLGDLVGYGPDPAGVVDRMRASGIPTVLGNYDEGIGLRRGDCGCYYATPLARSDGEAGYAFTEASIDDDRAAWLAALPHELRFTHGGRRVLLVHGSPRKVNEYLLPDRTDEQLVRLAEAADADIVCVGHVHMPYHRRPGRLGRHPHRLRERRLRGQAEGRRPAGACWTELTLGDEGSINADFHHIAYDIEAVAAKMRAAGLPETLITALRNA